MFQPPPSYALSLFVLIVLGACSSDSPSGETTSEASAAGGGDTSDDDTSDDSSSLVLDAGASGGSKKDASAGGQPMSGPKADAKVATPDDPPSKSDAATSGNVDGSTKPDSAASKPSEGRRPNCVKEDGQVILIGDSYINWISHSFPADLAAVSGQQWRNYAVGGSSLATGGIGLAGLGYIPDQLDAALAEDSDVHTMIMDGGGNDILVQDISIAMNSCTTAGSSKDPGCQEVIRLALEAARASIDKAAEAGVRDVVYFFYPRVPANTFLTDDDPNEILDYALPMAKDVCDGAEQQSGGKLRCTFVDMVPVFEGHPDYFNEDIHPNDKGSKAMADKIWQVMTDKCIGQKGPKDCCES